MDELFTQQVRPRSPIKGKTYHRLIYGLINEVNKGYAPVVIICGKTGIGKSTAAVRLAEILHNELNVMKGEMTKDRIKDNLVYDVIPFLDKVTNSEREVLIFDEGGVNVNSKDWHSDLNRSVDRTLQTMRIKNMVYIFIAPKLRDLDKSIRTSVDFRIIGDAKRSSKRKKKFKVSKVDPKYGKMNDGGKSMRKIILPPLWQPDLPSKKLRDAYEEKERSWKEEDLEQELEKLKEEERKKEREEKEVSADDIADLIKEEG